MIGENLYTLIPRESKDIISSREQLLESLKDQEYRREFVAERVRSSMALQIRSLREARKMSQKELGDAIGMAQTWVSRLENPDYGKMSVATLLRLAEAFDTDLEIKFRPFSTTIDVLPKQSLEYFDVPSFEEEFGSEHLSAEDEQKLSDIQARSRQPQRILEGSALNSLGSGSQGSDAAQAAKGLLCAIG